MSASYQLLRTITLLPSSNNVARVTGSTVGRSRSFFTRTTKPIIASQNVSTAKIKPAESSKPITTLQEANPRNLPDLWFNPTLPYGNGRPPLGQGTDKQPNERKLKLGKST